MSRLAAGAFLRSEEIRFSARFACVMRWGDSVGR